MWLLAGFVTMVAAVVAFSSLRPKPYAFLDRFHPKSEDLEMPKLYAVTHKPVPTMTPHVTLVEFTPEQSGDVLQAMRSELTPARGFSAQKSGYCPGGAAWQFVQGSSSGSSAMPDEGLYYVSGSYAASLRPYLDAGELSTPAPNNACFVVIYHKETLVDESLSWMAHVLHVR